MSGSSDKADYTIEPRDRYFEAVRSMAEYEINPGITVSLVSEVDLTEVEQIRAAAGPQRPSYTAFVAKAVALALKEFPYANRRAFRRPWLPFSAPRLQSFHRVDVAVMVERDLPGTPAASFADVLRDADQRSLAEMTTWLRDLATCDVNTNKQWSDYSWVVTHLPRWLFRLLLRLPCYSPSLWRKWRGGPVMISSPTKYGVDCLVASFPAPLGVSFGLVKLRPVVRDGQVVARPTFNLLLNFDRAIMAGAQGARFFKRIIDILEHAQTEMAPYLSAGSPAPADRQVQRAAT
jgi:pyruvate/2-oxoglutarate dehydrogenase complex dihydrolipoamide acyltransferase (E2) component